MLRFNPYYKTFFFLIAILLAVSCSTEGIPETDNVSELEKPKEEVEVIPEIELFERLDILEINRSISEATESFSPTDIMKMYYPSEKESEEGNETIKIKENPLEHEEMEVVLIHDGLMDDALKGLKYIMVLKQQSGKWKVVSLKKNWKCYKGRGHSFWGIDSCG